MLAATLKAGGATVHVCASNPLSTQDDVAAYLAKHEGIPTFAIKGEDGDTYYRHINQALDVKPQMTMDDGADLVFTVHTKRQELLAEIFAGTEETTTGVIRLKAMATDGVLRYPIIAVNDAMTKYLFDNRYGTGQSTLDGILRATNRLMAGSIFVVAGYGWCGRGLAMRARGMGARVVVTEVNPLKALEAIMDGYEVLPMAQAAKIGDIFCTLTGDINVIREEHFQVMKDGAILSNSGHFNVEIDIDGPGPPQHRPAADSGLRGRIHPEERHLPLSAGRRPPGEPGRGRRPPLGGHGHELCQPGPVRGIHFQEPRSFEKQVYPVPEDIDKEIARLKLAAMQVDIDTLTPEQEKYLASYDLGT